MSNGFRYECIAFVIENDPSENVPSETDPSENVDLTVEDTLLLMMKCYENTLMNLNFK